MLEGGGTGGVARASEQVGGSERDGERGVGVSPVLAAIAFHWVCLPMVASSTLQVCPYIYTVRASAYKCSIGRFLGFLESWWREELGRIVGKSR